MRFTKMHGIGNDYIYVDGFAQTVADPAPLAKVISDRHTGVGADGLILILPSDKADVRMRMFNADGSEAQMCGNGIRCLAKYAYEHGLARKNPMSVETGRGVLNLDLELAEDRVVNVTVDMGQPILELGKIPVNPVQIKPGRMPHEFRLDLWNMIFVSMGNPHAVMFVESLNSVDLPAMGPRVENHPAFPQRINAHWAMTKSRGELAMRSWERGSGITRACGTGVCAVAVAGILTGRCDRNVLVHLPGGDLKIDWPSPDSSVRMTGPAVEVFSGDWPA